MMDREEPVGEGKEGEDVVRVACSICLEVVKSGGDRAIAWLQCGHEFHLDCIGSAFNAKGVMQCPNCRKVEEGNWLYANGCLPTPPDFIDELIHDEDLYNHSYIESSVGGHWCPFSETARIPSLFEEGESSAAAPFRDSFGYHAIISENQSTMPSSHSCPFVAYMQPPQPSSSNQSFETIPDGPGYHQQWSYFSRPRDIHTHMMAASNLPYRGWEHRHHPSYVLNAHVNLADPASHFSRLDADGLPTADSLFHPFVLGHGSGLRSSPTSSSATSMVPPFLRNHINLHEVFQRQNSQNVHGTSIPQPVNPRGLNLADQCVPFLISSIPLDAEGIRNRHRLWERESVAAHLFSPLDREPSAWGSFPQANSALDSNSRMAFVPLHNGPERSSSVQAGYSQTIPPARMLSLM
ncbi:E3 ubiquitin-protein ligase IPI1-like [Curcuma longa]|uniref:E3 ubiquitin-protein ligase IPI1-like n=1 Tax=Curcuma longa TaxID=136217 RepID=UPI003D9F7C46